MAENNYENNQDLQPPAPPNSAGDELDAASKSLSEALRISFIILKIIMVVLVIAFLASGLRTIGPDERALVLRFGKIRGVGEKRILGPGLKLLFPYPIHELVRLPVEKKVNLAINSFWYFQTREEALGTRKPTRIPQTLDPIKDGYCITRSEKTGKMLAGFTGSDYNIVHCRWQLTYQIYEPESFFKNIYVEDVKPGEDYFEVTTQSITPLLESLFEDAVVTAMVNYTIDEAMFEQVAKVTEHVKRLFQEKLNTIKSGIKVVTVQFTDITWPRQVDEAFVASIKASQESQKAISEARTYAENTLNQAAGPVASELLAALRDETISEQKRELLLSQLSGAAREKIAEARAYRTKVVERAKANAQYLLEILPEYRKRPELVLREIYQGAIESVLNNANEIFLVQPIKGAEQSKFWLLINRNPTIKSKPPKSK